MPDQQPTLTRGSRGPQVRDLQQKLKQLRFYDQPIDDSFGPGCQAAVRRFQQVHRIPDTGIVGPITWRAIGQELDAATPIPPIPPATPSRPSSPAAGRDTPVIVAFTGEAEGGHPGATVQVASGGRFKLRWQVTGPMRTLRLQGAPDRVRGASGELELTARREMDLTLEARNDRGWDAKTVHVAIHAEHEEVSHHTEVQLRLPVSGTIFQGPLTPHGWAQSKYFELEVELAIQAQGAILVGHGVGSAAPEEGAAIAISPSGYDDGWKHALALKLDHRFGRYDITLEDISMAATLNHEGINFAVAAALELWGVSTELKVTLLKINREWRRSHAGEIELDVTVPFFSVDLPLGPDVRIDSLQISPHIKVKGQPRWGRIAAELARRYGTRVAERTLATAAEGSAESAAEGAAEAAAEGITEAEVEGAAAEAGAEGAAEDAVLLLTWEVLIASAALLAAIWVMVQFLRSLAQGEWNREAGAKVTELTRIYLEGFRKGLFAEAEPRDEKEKIGWRRGTAQLRKFRADMYRFYRANYPHIARAQVDEDMMGELRELWTHGRAYDKYREAEELCERTAKVTLFSSWAKEGHGGFTDWPDRGWAFCAVFGKNPHLGRSQLEPWERECWEHFYGAEYED